MSENNDVPQFTTTGRISQNRAGGECIKFKINLSFFTLQCVVNVPGENEEEAPVYVKFYVRKPEPGDKRAPRARKERTVDVDQATINTEMASD